MVRCECVSSVTCVVLGDMEVPLLVGENHCDYEKVTLREFISTYIRERSGTAYVKDWHFQR